MSPLLPLLPLLLLILLIAATFRASSAQLRTDFYRNTCPNVDSIVRTSATQKFQRNPNAVPGTVRLLFHDCFVEGCDASVMIASTPSNQAEKDATENLSLSGDGFDAVIQAKKAVEAKCPGVVSCADILVMVTRDLINLAGGPFYPVEKGRRDGRVSRAATASANLPNANFTHDQITSAFQKRGLSPLDMVALVGGGHTIGFVHCTTILNRLYSFQSKNKVDPRLNSEYVQQLKLACPKGVDPLIAIDFDPVTPKIFDNTFFQLLQHGKGLLSSDEILYTDGRTRGIVSNFAQHKDQFFNQFVKSVTALARVGVKTGAQGEIRRDCSVIN